MLFREIIAIHPKKHTKHKTRYVAQMQNSRRYTYSNRRALKC